jgi:hypothetical protein
MLILRKKKQYLVYASLWYVLLPPIRRASMAEVDVKSHVTSRRNLDHATKLAAHNTTPLNMAVRAMPYHL